MTSGNMGIFTIFVIVIKLTVTMLIDFYQKNDSNLNQTALTVSSQFDKNKKAD
jgi:hypothetical protein